jgi:hypothetical protein
MDSTTSHGNFGRGINRLNPLMSPPEMVFDASKSPTAVNTTPDFDLRYEDYKSIEDYKQKRKAQLDAKGSSGAFSSELHAKFESEYHSHRERIGATRSLWNQYKETTLVSVEGAVLSTNFVTRSENLPKTFTAKNAASFYRFFDLFGTDVATSEIECSTLQFRTMIDKFKFADSYNFKASVQAEYGTFFDAEAKGQQSEESKHFMQNRIASITTEGGDGSRFAGISFDKPGNYYKQAEAWLKSAKENPAKIGGTFQKTFAFIRDAEQRQAAEKAHEYYLKREVEVTSNWQFASLTVGDAAPRAGSAAATPAIKVRLLDRKTSQGADQTFAMPSADPSREQIDAYWQGLHDKLEKDPALPAAIVLLATERWPRDSRFCPPDYIRAFLRSSCGARQITLDRWREDSSKADICPVAGVTYGLIGHGTGRYPDTGSDCDAYAIGFGEPGKSLLPTIRISAYLSSTEDGSSVLNLEDASSSKATLTTITSGHWNSHRIVADKTDEGRVILESTSEPLRSAALWYMHSAPDKYGVRSLAYLFNASSGKCLEWDSGGAAKFAEAVLSRYVPNRDINLWEKSFPRLRNLSYNVNWSLRAYPNMRVAVSPYNGLDTEFDWTPKDIDRVL